MNMCGGGEESVMDKFGEKIREALHETVNGFEVSDETKERIAEKIKKADYIIENNKICDSCSQINHLYNRG